MTFRPNPCAITPDTLTPPLMAPFTQERRAILSQWLQALRQPQDSANAQALPSLTPNEAAWLMQQWQAQKLSPSPVLKSVEHATGAGTAPHPATPLRPRLTLMTLGRGDGLLGMRAQGQRGPRADSVTLARIDWTYDLQAHSAAWHTPAPTSVLNTRPPVRQEAWNAQGQRLEFQRDLAGEADAMDLVWEMGFQPVDLSTLQWRDAAQAPALGSVWTLAQEAQFGDWWAEQVPRLRSLGWRIIVQPGFAHEGVTVQRWKLLIAPDTGQWLGKELDTALPAPARAVQKLHLPAREGAWLLSLGIEIDGELLDLVPLLADLLRRDARWLDRAQMASIDDHALISLRAPGGKRVQAPAGPLKALVGNLVDLLTDPSRHPTAPLRLGGWELHRLEALRSNLLQAQRISPHNHWALQGDAGLAQLAQRLQTRGSPQPVAAPQGLAVALRPYQREGLAWLQYLRQQHLGGILADDMGLGKTVQALAHIQTEKEAGRLTRPALVVVPTSLLFNWQSEAQRMAPGLRVLCLHGSQRMRWLPHMAQADLVLTTYPLLWRDVQPLSAQPFHLLILDEAQVVKNAASRSARALRRLEASHPLCLTGTPLENHLGELWAQFDFLMPGFLGDQRQFNARWRKPIEDNGETLRAALLAQRVRPFVLRRRKQDVATELPPRTEVIQHVQLVGRQRELYETLRVAADQQVRRVLQSQSFAGAQIRILDALLKLRQVCCDPRLIKGEALVQRTATMERAKLELLSDMLPALVQEGRRVLVFSQFTALLTLVADWLHTQGLPFLMLTGDTPAPQRGPTVEQFQAGEIPLFLISLKAGGTGLNLTAADTVIHLDPWWNPAVQEQATARVHRIGQTQPVFVYHIVVQGSIEERMLELQARKAALAQGVLGHDAPGAVKFTEADLAALLSPLPETSINDAPAWPDARTPEPAAPAQPIRRWGGTAALLGQAMPPTQRQYPDV